MATTSEARIAIVGEDRFSRTFDNLKRDLGSLRAEAAGLGNLQFAGLASVGGVFTTASLAALGAAAAFRGITSDLDALNDSADAVGDSIENLSGLEDVARRNGEGIDLVSTALLKLNKELAAAKPDSAIAGALRAIGLDAAELRRQAPTDALVSISRALAGFADDADKARLVQALFGKSVKEVGPFLKDLAEAGKLNTTATSDQAREAEIFNKQLAELSTNAGNAARSIVGSLLPAINGLFKQVREGGVKSLLGDTDINNEFRQLTALRADIVKAAVSLEIGKADFLKQSLNPEAYAMGIKRLNGELLAAQKAAKDYEKTFYRISGVEGGRGVVNPPSVKPALGDVLGSDEPAKTERRTAAIKAQVTEAERYLQTLQKQGERLQELTTLEQAQADIAKRRIDGITPALEKQILSEAGRVDLQKQLNKELAAEVEARKEIFDFGAKGRADTIALLDDTELAKIEKARFQMDALRELMRDPAFQSADAANKILELQDRISELANGGTGDKVASEFDKIADAIEASMARSTNALIDFAVSGTGSLGDVWKAFRADVLRALVEEPINKMAKKVAGTLKKMFSEIAADSQNTGSIIDSILKAFGGAGGGDSSNWFSWVAGLFGSTSRANGGRVSAGQSVRVNENGIETFIPGADGTILSARQTRQAMQGGGRQLVYSPTIHINGDVSAATVALVQNMLSRNNAQIMRSMRTGGAFAA